jgi:hypothetical protein
MENMEVRPPANIFEYITYFGSDEGFLPAPPPQPTLARPGTLAKLAELETRVRSGLDLWHAEDPIDWNEQTADDARFAAIPRNTGRKNFHGLME